MPRTPHRFASALVDRAPTRPARLVSRLNQPLGDDPAEHVWMTIAVAARALGMSDDALRVALRRRSVRADDGTVMAELDGVLGRKLGRGWRVRLTAGWIGADPIVVERPRHALDRAILGRPEVCGKARR